MYHVASSMYQDRTLILDCLNKKNWNKDINLFGWVQNIRIHGGVAFFDLKDRSGIIQVVATNPTEVDKISALNTYDAVKIIGRLKKRKPEYSNKEWGKLGEIELEMGTDFVISAAEKLPFDFGGRELNLELPTLLDYRPLTLRHPKISAIFEVQAEIVDSFRKTAESLGCTEIFVPNIASGASEGGADVFEVDYYGHKAYLTQSPQLYKQMMVPVFERVYTISKAYRAEPSVTTFHLSENTQMDCEFGFVDFSELLDLLEETAKGILKVDKTVKLSKKVPRLSLKEAFELLKKKTEADLSRQDEADLSKWALEKYGSDILTVHHFPTRKRAFYTMPDPKDPEFSLSYDIIFRGLEISSGSQRINDYNQLVQTMEERELDPKNFGMYLMAFKYGMPPEGGFSFGLERITMKVMGLENVREASLFPRDMERVDERFSKIKK